MQPYKTKELVFVFFKFWFTAILSNLFCFFFKFWSAVLSFFTVWLSTTILSTAGLWAPTSPSLFFDTELWMLVPFHHFTTCAQLKTFLLDFLKLFFRDIFIQFWLCLSMWAKKTDVLIVTNLRSFFVNFIIVKFDFIYYLPIGQPHNTEWHNKIIM